MSFLTSRLFRPKETYSLYDTGTKHKIVNKDGITLEELSDPRSKHYVKSGRGIQPGEPADLVRKDWIPIYKKLGRDRTIELVKNGTSLKEAKKIAKEETK